MKLISQFVCDVCRQPVAVPDGMVVWDDRDYSVSLFVVHNWPTCRSVDTLGTCPISCTLAMFIASNGLRECFSLLAARRDYPVPQMKRFVAKGVINLDAIGFSLEEFLQRPAHETEADLAVRRANLRRSIAESVARFFEDFDEEAYFLSDEELRVAIMEDLAGEGSIYI
ncbi:MAG: hypothetical protein ACE5H6_01035 [Dehalococcoidia bacterium]